MTLKFSKANSKLIALTKSRRMAKFVKNNRKVYSFDILSGWSCPFAKECLAKVHVNPKNGTKSIVDGKDATVRCFSAMQEVFFKNAYESRKTNFELLKASDNLYELLSKSLPKNAGIVRIHVSGDFFSQDYFNAWLELAKNNPSILFYAYTKSLIYWVNKLSEIPDNFVLTASRGGRLDSYIEKYNLRTATIVFSPSEAKKLKLKIDHTDENAADPKTRNKNFALLIHGIQKKGTLAAKAILLLKKRNVKFSYGKKHSYGKKAA